MNTSFNPLQIVNTYGAFGSVTRERYEIVIEGTDDDTITRPRVARVRVQGQARRSRARPPQVAPYHLRLDWLMWFAAMSSRVGLSVVPELLLKLLEGDPGSLSLLRSNPFPYGPPRWIRAQLYLYRFTSPDERRRTGRWWNRERVSPGLPAVRRGLTTSASSLRIELADWPYFDAALAGGRDLCRDLNRLVQIPRVNEVKAGKLLLRLGERAVRDRHRAVAHAYRWPPSVSAAALPPRPESRSCESLPRTPCTPCRALRGACPVRDKRGTNTSYVSEGVPGAEAPAPPVRWKEGTLIRLSIGSDPFQQIGTRGSGFGIRVRDSNSKTGKTGTSRPGNW